MTAGTVHTVLPPSFVFDPADLQAAGFRLIRRLAWLRRGGRRVGSRRAWWTDGRRTCRSIGCAGRSRVRPRCLRPSVKRCRGGGGHTGCPGVTGCLPKAKQKCQCDRPCARRCQSHVPFLLRLLTQCGPPQAELALTATLHIRMDRLNLGHFHSQWTPGRHALLRTAGTYRLNEELLGRDRPTRLERHDQMGRDRGALNVLSVAASAVQVVLLPAIVHLLCHGIEGCLVVHITQRCARFGRCGSARFWWCGSGWCGSGWCGLGWSRRLGAKGLGCCGPRRRRRGRLGPGSGGLPRRRGRLRRHRLGNRPALLSGGAGIRATRARGAGAVRSDAACRVARSRCRTSGSARSLPGIARRSPRLPVATASNQNREKENIGSMD